MPPSWIRRSARGPKLSHGKGAARRDGSVAATRTIVTVGADFADGLVGGDLVQKFGEHRRIPNPTTGHLDPPYLQRVRIDTQMDLAPLAWLQWPVFLGAPLAITLGLDPRAIDQKVQGTVALAIRDGDVQTFLTTAERAEVRHRPVKPSKVQKAGDQPGRQP